MFKSLLAALVFFTAGQSSAWACTNILVSPGASKDGSAMIVYLNDGEWIQQLQKYPAADHEKGEWLKVGNGQVKQIAHTYGRIGFQMNEKQVAIGETTFTGREELWNHDVFLKYWHLMELALDRSASAREAIEVMTSLVEEYGYGSEGESFSIADKNEAWILEMIGAGADQKGAVWVARKVPDGMISAHANHSRIGEFPLDDPENCLYSENVVSLAIERGYYDPNSGEPFRFNEVYCPATPASLRYCESRVWSIFRRAAPSQNFSPDYHRGVKGAKPYPLFIQPDYKIGVAELMALVRDHYEGTRWDMTKGLEAGPYGTPNRDRPLTFKVDGEDCAWERPISNVNTAFSFISQSRAWLPDAIGGVMWYSPDDTFTNCYTPFYPAIQEIPEAYAKGDQGKFSWESAWWAFNFVSNYINLKYSYMIQDVLPVQKQLETQALARQDSVEQAALKIYATKPADAILALNNYCSGNANEVVKEWRELGQFLVMKYIDGYMNDERGSGQTAGYTQEWYDRAVQDKSSLRNAVWNEKEESKEPQSY
ncbi:dipeptidase [Mangrovibacterium lignilyticum]|uniref:dipeptidase n=1 Tax=Mangrovibacterium lignilyticum TaxID=2668052 RepID=UPI0013D37488|nr:C69 family dipeptidase [Mangrovibacterium lignilyticum]